MNIQALNDDLLEIIGHLGAADIQSIDSDDQIIMGHMRDAYRIAVKLRHQAYADLRKQQAEAV